MANGEFLTVPKITACFRLPQLDRRCSMAIMLQCNSSHYGLQVMVVIVCTCLSVCLYVCYCSTACTVYPSVANMVLCIRSNAKISTKLKLQSL